MSTIAVGCSRTYSNDQITGISRESKMALRSSRQIYEHYYSPTSRYNYFNEFHDLLATWRNDTRHLSVIREILLHPAYLSIIGMGDKIIPLLLRELEKSPDHLVWALKAITHADIVPSIRQARITDIVHAWLGWAKRTGYEW